MCVCVREREGGKDKAEEPWQRDQGREYELLSQLKKFIVLLDFWFYNK